MNAYCLWCMLWVHRQIFCPVWCLYAPALTALLLEGHTRDNLRRTILGPLELHSQMLQEQKVPGVLCLLLSSQYPMTEVQEFGNLALMRQGGADLPVHFTLQSYL